MCPARGGLSRLDHGRWRDATRSAINRMPTRTPTTKPSKNACTDNGVYSRDPRPATQPRPAVPPPALPQVRASLRLDGDLGVQNHPGEIDTNPRENGPRRPAAELNSDAESAQDDARSRLERSPLTR